MGMRRLLTFAAFLLSLSVMPVYAQHGGHGGGGGSHGGFSGGHSGSGGHGAIGGHSVGGGFSGSHSGFAGGGFAGGSHFGSDTRPGFGSRGFRGNRYGYGYGFRSRSGYGYPYYGYPYGYYDPFLDSWWWDSGSSSDQDYAQQQQMAEQMNEDNLEEQQMLDRQDQDAYAPRARRDPQPSREETARNDPATVLVFRNGQQREIQNYAIVDGMLWNFTGTRTERIPLAVLDIPATVRANDDRGVDFHLPGTGEGQ